MVRQEPDLKPARTGLEMVTEAAAKGSTCLRRFHRRQRALAENQAPRIGVPALLASWAPAGSAL